MEYKYIVTAERKELGGFGFAIREFSSEDFLSYGPIEATSDSHAMARRIAQALNRTSMEETGPIMDEL